MPPPTRVDDAAYLEAAARIIFMGGLNRQVVDNKWPGFRDAFHAFDVAQVAAMTPEDLDRLAADDRVIKYRAKLAAVIENAGHIQARAQSHGSFDAYVVGLLDADGVPGTARQLARQFAYISEEGARHWLYSTGHDIGEVSEKVARKYAPFVAP